MATLSLAHVTAAVAVGNARLIGRWQRKVTYRALECSGRFAVALGVAVAILFASSFIQHENPHALRGSSAAFTLVAIMMAFVAATAMATYVLAALLSACDRLEAKLWPRAAR